MGIVQGFCSKLETLECDHALGNAGPVLCVGQAAHCVYKNGMLKNVLLHKPAAGGVGRGTAYRAAPLAEPTGSCGANS
jgi:hypothetical protein